MAHRIARACGILLGLTFLSSPASAATPSLLDVSCGVRDYPTGCAAPYETCAFGKRLEARQSCRRAAKRDACPDFTWEKCCYVTCRQSHGTARAGFDECMQSCNGAPEAFVYVPKAPERLSTNNGR